MNVFRLSGDLAHLLAIIILIVKMWRTRSVAGISGKSQFLFALVFTTRYLDLATNLISPYNTIMKIFFLISTYGTLYLVFNKFKATYDSNHDTFRAEFLIIPAAGMSVLVNHEFTVLEILWTFSIYLESVAVMPQLYMISKTGEAETITSHYLFALGCYRALYVVNWAYRFYLEGYYDIIAIAAGCVQTALYCDFFYLYITKGIPQDLGDQKVTVTLLNQKMELDQKDIVKERLQENLGAGFQDHSEISTHTYQATHSPHTPHQESQKLHLQQSVQHPELNLLFWTKLQIPQGLIPHPQVMKGKEMKLPA